MSCCNVVQTKRAVRSGEAGPIMGTWDYKWPQGSSLRVAFQKPAKLNDDQFGQVKGVIRSLAQTWNKSPAAIRFDFSPIPDFPPPSSGKDKAAPQPHPQHRSKVEKGVWHEYDLLVSLEELPLTIAETLTDAQHRVFLPTSELGSYARRIDYGTPTMYIGPMKKLEAKDWAAHYEKDPLARTMVIHEFGHALGLAHEHQSPVFREQSGLNRESYDLEKARQLLIHRLGVPAEELPGEVDLRKLKEEAEQKALAPKVEETNKFLTAHLGLNWPGNLRFSTWRDYKEGARLDTIMAVPYHDCALKGATCGCADAAQSICGNYQAALHTQPTDSDLTFLAKLYPPS